MRSISARILAVVALLTTGCGGEKPTGPAPIASIAVAPVSLTLKVGETQALSATILDARGMMIAGRAVSWSVSDPAIAQITAAGSVTALAVGQTTVSASAEGKQATALLSVQRQPVASVQVTEIVSSIRIHQSLQLAARAIDINGRQVTDRPISWSSSNPLVASVNASGTMRTERVGVARITATSEGQSSGFEVTVTPITAQYCGPQRSEWAARRTNTALDFYQQFVGETVWQRVSDTAAFPAVIGKYVVVNSVSSTRSDAGKVCGAATSADTNQVDALFTWNYTSPQTGGYFNVHSGVLDYTNRATPGTSSTDFPVRVDRISENMRVSFESEFTFPQDDVLLLDVFFYPTASSDWRYTKELMLVLNDVSGDEDGWKKLPVRTIGDYAWAWGDGWSIQKPSPFFLQDSSSYLLGKHITLANHQKPSPFKNSFSLRLKPLIERLLSEGFLEPSDHMVMLQVGVEPRAGLGRLQLLNYRLQTK